MFVGLHDAELEHMKRKTFPNYALMKISAWHKAQGDTVELFVPTDPNGAEQLRLFPEDEYPARRKAQIYDKVYSSKVFTFTPENPYLPIDAIKGGTGYDVKSKLPIEIEHCLPDYSIYRECGYSLGFTTRGCPNHCPWCVVPEKEGDIHPYKSLLHIVRTEKDMLAPNKSKIVLMDNNILASEFGIEQLELLTQITKNGAIANYSLDINQGLDARLATPDIANILAKINWIRYIRFACDSTASIEPLEKAVKLLAERGISSSKIFVYFLVNDINDAMERVRALRKLGSITLYAQAYRDFANCGKTVSKEATYFAQKYIYSGQWRKQDWKATPWGAKFN